MRNVIFYAVLISFLITGTNVFAQSSVQSEGTKTLSKKVLKAEKQKKKRKYRGLTRYEETDLERQAEFLAAVSAGNLQEAKEKKAAHDFYAYDHEGENPLTRAIKNRDVEMVRFLEETAVINLENKLGETPLILAIESGNQEIIDLIMRRANPTVQNAKGVSPIMAALAKSNERLILSLIKHGADLNIKSNGITPLFRAVELSNLKAVAMFVHHGADPSIANDDGDIPLYYAVRNGDNIITGILLERSKQAKVDANWKNGEGEPLLNLAIKHNHDQISRMLLDFGALTSQTDYLENTPINLAAEQGNTELIEILLERGADPNHRNIIGETPIITAARGGYSHITEILTQAGADATISNYNGLAADNSRNLERLTDPEIVDAVMEMTEDNE